MKPIIETDSKLIPVICGLSRASLEDIVRIENLSDRPAWNEKLFAQEFANQHSHIFGARVEGQLVGFLVCHCLADEAHILKFGVLPQYRRKGIGRSILCHVIRDLHANTAKWVTLEVRRSNHVAQSLYHSVGFTEVGIRERYYSDDGEDALVMSLNVAHFIDEHGDHPHLENDVNGTQRAFHLF
ncbi:MAG: ribosomal protein S18-alanine N-acetyltransferase [Deltaproteobacteria bacterium]|nr:ribosomal protein S18-alanine N-acetyltransferase [Deltaproteobacteria bacterium]